MKDWVGQDMKRSWPLLVGVLLDVVAVLVALAAVALLLG